MQVNWSKYLFLNFRRRRKSKVIGHEMIAYCRFNGKFTLIDGMCVEKKSKNEQLLTTSFTLRRKGETVFFTSFPIYLTGAINYKIVGLIYGFNTNYSRISECRFKK